MQLGFYSLDANCAETKPEEGAEVEEPEEVAKEGEKE